MMIWKVGHISNISTISKMSKGGYQPYHWAIPVADWTTNQSRRKLREGLNGSNPCYIGWRVVFEECLEIVCLIDSEEGKTTVSLATLGLHSCKAYPNELI